MGSVIEGEWIGKVGSGNRLLMSATFFSKKEEKSSAVRVEGGGGGGGWVKKCGEGREKFVRVRGRVNFVQEVVSFSISYMGGEGFEEGVILINRVRTDA